MPSPEDIAFAKDTLLVLAHFPPPREDDAKQRAHDTLRRGAQAVLHRAAFRVLPPDDPPHRARGRAPRHALGGLRAGLGSRSHGVHRAGSPVLMLSPLLRTIEWRVRADEAKWQRRHPTVAIEGMGPVQLTRLPAVAPCAEERIWLRQTLAAGARLLGARWAGFLEECQRERGEPGGTAGAGERNRVLRGRAVMQKWREAQC